MFRPRWKDEASLHAWKEVAEHKAVQRRAGAWYAGYRVRICRVERDCGTGQAPGPAARSTR